jgi:hypothetical protein
MRMRAHFAQRREIANALAEIEHLKIKTMGCA